MTRMEDAEIHDKASCRAAAGLATTSITTTSFELFVRVVKSALITSSPLMQLRSTFTALKEPISGSRRDAVSKIHAAAAAVRARRKESRVPWHSCVWFSDRLALMSSHVCTAARHEFRREQRYGRRVARRVAQRPRDNGLTSPHWAKTWISSCACRRSDTCTEIGRSCSASTRVPLLR